MQANQGRSTSVRRELYLSTEKQVNLYRKTCLIYKHFCVCWFISSCVISVFRQIHNVHLHVPRLQIKSIEKLSVGWNGHRDTLAHEGSLYHRFMTLWTFHINEQIHDERWTTGMKTQVCFELWVQSNWAEHNRAEIVCLFFAHMFFF